MGRESHFRMAETAQARCGANSSVPAPDKLAEDSFPQDHLTAAMPRAAHSPALPKRRHKPAAARAQIPPSQVPALARRVRRSTSARSFARRAAARPATAGLVLGRFGPARWEPRRKAGATRPEFEIG